MINALYTLLGAVLVLGVMILVHEFGHFAAAKLLGVRVEVFSIGFGKRLFGFREAIPTTGSQPCPWAAT